MRLENFFNTKKKIYLFILLTIVLIVAIASLIYYVWYLNKQNEVIILNSETFTIETQSGYELVSLANKWCEKYLEQYTQKYVKRKYAIKSFYIDEVEVLDEEKKIVKLSFTIIPESKMTDYFKEPIWNSIKYENENIYKCDWVVTFDTKTVNGKKVFYLVNKSTIGSYEMGKYVTSDQAQYDEEYYSYMNEQKFLNLEYTYKIENGNLHLTYDSGSTYIQIPFKLNHINETSYKLENGTFFISPELTYICDIIKDKRIVYLSKDKGKTWEEKQINIDGAVRYIKYINENIAYAFLAQDFAMGNVATVAIKTIDGGNTWEKTGYSDWLRNSSTFLVINENVSFIVERTADGTSGTLYRSEDGCKTYSKVELPTYKVAGDLEKDETKWAEKWYSIYDTPEIPFFENNILNLNVGQGSDGDYEGGNLYARYISSDLGKTWAYKEQFKPAPKKSEG